MTTYTHLTHEEKIKRLEALRNYGTCYEFALAAPDGTAYFLGYLARANATGLRRCLYRAAPFLAKVLGTTVERIVLEARTKRAADLSINAGWSLYDKAEGAPRWHIYRTGRTERDCINEGELPIAPVQKYHDYQPAP
jgi:hypothetical protein